MSEKETVMLDSYKKLPADLQDKFTERMIGAAMTVEMLSNTAQSEDRNPPSQHC